VLHVVNDVSESVACNYQTSDASGVASLLIYVFNTPDDAQFFFKAHPGGNPSVQGYGDQAIFDQAFRKLLVLKGNLTLEFGLSDFYIHDTSKFQSIEEQLATIALGNIH
jgi:hypothetical protein